MLCLEEVWNNHQTQYANGQCTVIRCSFHLNWKILCVTFPYHRISYWSRRCLNLTKAYLCIVWDLWQTSFWIIWQNFSLLVLQKNRNKRCWNWILTSIKISFKKINRVFDAKLISDSDFFNPYDWILCYDIKCRYIFMH